MGYFEHLFLAVFCTAGILYGEKAAGAEGKKGENDIIKNSYAVKLNARRNKMSSLHSFATSEELCRRLRSTKGIRRFPPATDRKSWDKMYRGDLQKIYTAVILEEAPKIVDTPWPECSLKLFTRYIKTGDRSAYQAKYFERRRRLNILAVAEAIENRGRYVEEIAEGMWQIISEPTWAYPAHERFNAPDPVPVLGKTEVVDLGASDTGLMLSAIMELIEPQLLAYSPALMERVKKEIIRRVVEPLEAEDDEPWWLRKEIYFPSNWIPWCCSNSFGAATYVLRDDPERLARLTWKMFSAVDKFIGVYKPDGACDEGPGYWNHSVAQMYQFMDQVNRRTEGLYDDFFKQQKIRRMGEFIADLNLTGSYFMNYADAQSQIKTFDCGILYSFGESISSELLKSFSIKIAEENKNDVPRCNSLMQILHLFRFPFKLDLSAYAHKELSYFPDRQIFIVRQNAKNTREGFIAAIKGGHNNEGHNHNDVGNFSIYCGGKPLIVDVGSGTYTRKTFSPERYSIWWIGGKGHNAAIINGNAQPDGEKYFSKVREINTKGDRQNITLDLSAIYPPEVGVKEYLRSLELDRKIGVVMLRESLAMNGKAEADIEIKLYSPRKIVSFSENQVKWDDAVMKLENIRCVSVNEVDLRDEKVMASSWGKLYCITLSLKMKGPGGWKLIFNTGILEGNRGKNVFGGTAK